MITPLAVQQPWQPSVCVCVCKRMVYKAVVLSTLLYGAKTWTVLARHVRRLTVFHHASIRTILGVSHAQQ